MFSMAERTAKRLPAPAGEGWIVVRLDDIEPGKVAAGDPAIAGLARQLGALTGREYAEQFRRAVRREVGVERNAAAIRSVRDRLVGGN
jgi:peptidyl-prolyl cis-trans isomerase D